MQFVSLVPTNQPPSPLSIGCVSWAENRVECVHAILFVYNIELRISMSCRYYDNFNIRTSMLWLSPARSLVAILIYTSPVIRSNWHGLDIVLILERRFPADTLSVVTDGIERNSEEHVP